MKTIFYNVTDEKLSDSTGYSTAVRPAIAFGDYADLEVNLISRDGFANAIPVEAVTFRAALDIDRNSATPPMARLTSEAGDIIVDEKRSKITLRLAADTVTFKEKVDNKTEQIATLEIYGMNPANETVYRIAFQVNVMPAVDPDGLLKPDKGVKVTPDLTLQNPSGQYVREKNRNGICAWKPIELNKDAVYCYSWEDLEQFSPENPEWRTLYYASGGVMNLCAHLKKNIFLIMRRADMVFQSTTENDMTLEDFNAVNYFHIQCLYDENATHLTRHADIAGYGEDIFFTAYIDSSTSPWVFRYKRLDAINAVKTVNGTAPDVNGNVTVAAGGSVDSMQCKRIQYAPVLEGAPFPYTVTVSTLIDTLIIFQAGPQMPLGYYVIDISQIWDKITEGQGFEVTCDKIFGFPSGFVAIKYADGYELYLNEPSYVFRYNDTLTIKSIYPVSKYMKMQEFNITTSNSSDAQFSARAGGDTDILRITESGTYGLVYYINIDAIHEKLIKSPRGSFVKVKYIQSGQYRAEIHLISSRGFDFIVRADGYLLKGISGESNEFFYYEGDI